MVICQEAQCHGFSQSEGCILPNTYSSCTEEVPLLHSGTRGPAVQGTLLQNVDWPSSGVHLNFYDSIHLSFPVGHLPFFATLRTGWWLHRAFLFWFITKISFSSGMSTRRLISNQNRKQSILSCWSTVERESFLQTFGSASSRRLQWSSYLCLTFLHSSGSGTVLVLVSFPFMYGMYLQFRSFSKEGRCFQYQWDHLHMYAFTMIYRVLSWVVTPPISGWLW